MLLVSSTVLPSRCQLAVQSRAIPLRAGAGKGLLLLSRSPISAAGSVPLNLNVGPLIDSETQAVLQGSTVSLKSSAESNDLPVSIKPNQSLVLQIVVVGAGKADQAQAQVYNGDSLIGLVQAYSSDAALDLSAEGDGTPEKPLAYTYGEPVAINLKNRDGQAHTLGWTFSIGNQIESSGEIRLPQGETRPIRFTPAEQSFSFLDWLHPSIKKGLLTLSTHGPSGVSGDALPQRSVPVTLVMQRLTPFFASVWAYGYVVVLLLLGGLFSFLGSSMLPNMQRKGDLRARLQELANRTSAVSTRVDSYLRVLLRLERNRISSLISNAPAWITASTDPLSVAATLTDTLAKRLAAAEHVDELRRKHSQISASAPPSVTDAIDELLQAAADELHSTSLTDTDLAAANASFAKVQAYFDLLEDSEALAKQIAGSVAIVIARLEKFPHEYFGDLADRLPGIFIIADPARGYSDAKNIVRPMLFAIDHGVAAIHHVLDYAMVRASIPVPLPSKEPSNPKLMDFGEKALTRLLAREGRLIELLGTLSWRSLRDASFMIQEMREDTYEEDVLLEISKPGQAEIGFDTQQVRPYQPVFFTIQFKDSRFNGAAALQRLLCRWTFPGDADECTWKVCHYFSAARVERLSTLSLTNLEGSRSVEIMATIRGQQFDESSEVPTPPLKRTIQIQRAAVQERSRFWAELLQFAIAFSVALAGLLSGALDQLGKLDVIPASIAIVGLGFSASAIKNLLTQSQGATTRHSA